MNRLRAVVTVGLAVVVALCGWQSLVEAGCHRRGGGYGARWPAFGPPPLARLLAGGYGHGGHPARRPSPPAQRRQQVPEASSAYEQRPTPGGESSAGHPTPAAESPATAAESGNDSPQPGGEQVDGAGATGQPAVQGVDVALIDVRLSSAADAARGVGPVYRVFLRNTGTVDIARPIQVAVLVGRPDGLGTTAPATAELPNLAVGATAAVDVQLEASLATATLAGGKLYVVVDSQQRLEEVDEANNLAELGLDQIQPVLPGVLRLSPEAVAPGSILRIEGNGFGEVPGQVVLEVNGVKLLAEVVSWSDGLVCVRLPSLVLDGPTTAQIVVVPPNDDPYEGLELRLASH